MKAKKFLVLAIIIIIIVIIGLCFGEKSSMSAYSFISSMEKQGYIVINNLIGDGDSILPNRQIEKLEALDPPLESYTAVNDSLTTEFLFQIFPTEDDAIQLVARYKNRKKLDVTREQKVGDYNLKDFGSSTSNRNGINYQRTYMKDYNERYFLISRIDNTLLIGSIHEDDHNDINGLFNIIGY